ncbi:MAG: CHC2 zinc finger domain-containing protein [Candidatus Dormibacteria bacterium]
MTSASVVSRVTVADVLRLVGVVVPADPRRLVQCPLHDDRTPSMRVFPRGYVCYGCSQRGGLLDLVVALGLADDRASAARYLEERFG